MTEKRYLLVKCILDRWGIVDKTLEGVDQLILTHPNKLVLNNIVNELNEKERLQEENEELKEKNKHLGKKIQQLEDLIIHMGYTIKNENGIITLELKR